MLKSEASVTVKIGETSTCWADSSLSYRQTACLKFFKNGLYCFAWKEESGLGKELVM